MKSFKEYLAEAEIGQVTENSNLPSANDSTSPINGSTVDYHFAEKLRRNPPQRKPKIVEPNQEKPIFPANLDSK